ncbi:nicotinate-nucleotide--dimethylbenzimidazole phosphoribosyltransferase [Methylibium rhizosphaerae]|uniref:nicotinate-nucleotide--dimethylbenzimidazole phosphoribosyltransferase n=1 Tax=Methylibium rhizosphaerae TaxID=2570323 RepID=UPI00112E9762|nr:nicotinate-nucleotide--dimethylbenzimidazole phosphoribosyltransferase [Methylibium rhizosphaerae]
MLSTSQWLPDIDPVHDAALHVKLQRRIDRKTKPQGALGRIEELALQLGLVLRSEAPQLREPQMVVFAADHGLAARGVSAYPQAVTAQMVSNMLAGGAAVSVLARQHGLALTVVDAGVNADTPAGEYAGARRGGPESTRVDERRQRSGLLLRKMGPGTRDPLLGPAMTAEQCVGAVAAGRAVVRGLPGNVVLLGEMGIGNTSSASLLLSRLTGTPIERCTGRGTGLGDQALARKTQVLRDVLDTHALAREPLEVLAAFGGFEIAMMVGAALQAASERRVVVVDGFIATSALLVAHALRPAVHGYCVYAHRSGEAGHALMLEHLGAQPLLDLGLRLGEGSGAALAWPLIDSAARLLCEMASFESAGVSDAL